MNDLAIITATVIAVLILIIGASVAKIMGLLRVVVDDAPRGALKYECAAWLAAPPDE